MEKHLVIIGGVAAGAKAAAKARRDDPDLKISVFNAGKHISYSACGLPYYVEDEFYDYKRLLVRSPETFRTKENINIYLEYQVLQIIPENHKVIVENINTKEKSEMEYTKLLISTGSRPYVPPIEGVNLKNVFTLRTIEDGIEIKDQIANSKKAVIIGGGYIGIEMAESFRSQGLEVTMVELLPQILTALDEDMAFQVQKYIEEEKNVAIITNDGVSRIIGDEQGRVKQVMTNSGKILDADIVLLAIGVKPNVDLAEAAGIELGSTGAIKVNEKMETNITDIYAAGDCVESIVMVSGTPVWMPLGSVANKQGRVAAVNITGGYDTFKGVLGSLVTKFFDYTVTKTGLGENDAKKLGYDYEVAIVPHKDRAGYMYGAETIVIKMLADKLTRKLLGGQVIGKGNADKRINVIATALTANMTVDEFLDIDLTYAPPYSPAIDPVLTTAQVLQNKLDKKAEGISFSELQRLMQDKKECCVIDVRDVEEFQKSHLNTAKNMPFDALDLEKLKESSDGKIIVYCEQGVRSYLTTLKLREKGINNVSFVNGGLCTCSQKFKNE